MPPYRHLDSPWVSMETKCNLYMNLLSVCTETRRQTTHWLFSMHLLEMMSVMGKRSIHGFFDSVTNTHQCTASYDLNLLRTKIYGHFEQRHISIEICSKCPNLLFVWKCVGSWHWRMQLQAYKQSWTLWIFF